MFKETRQVSTEFPQSSHAAVRFDGPLRIVRSIILSGAFSVRGIRFRAWPGPTVRSEFEPKSQVDRGTGRRLERPTRDWIGLSGVGDTLYKTVRGLKPDRIPRTVSSQTLTVFVRNPQLTRVTVCIPEQHNVGHPATQTLLRQPCQIQMFRKSAIRSSSLRGRSKSIRDQTCRRRNSLTSSCDESWVLSGLGRESSG